MVELKNLFPITKNDRLKKYEARNEAVQIDIYLPYFSDLGLPVEEIIKEVAKIETFVLPTPEMLLILKQFTYSQRYLFAKGQKDMLDIISLLSKTTIDWKKYKNLLTKFKIEIYSHKLQEIIKSNTHILQLDLNQHAYSRMKKGILKQLVVK